MDFNIRTGSKVNGQMSEKAADRYAEKTGSAIKIISIGGAAALILWALSPVLVALIDRLL